MHESPANGVDCYVLAGGGLLLAGFGIYKAAPHIKRFVSEKVTPRLRKAKAQPSDPDELADEADDTTIEVDVPEQ